MVPTAVAPPMSVVTMAISDDYGFLSLNSHNGLVSFLGARGNMLTDTESEHHEDQINDPVM